MSNPFLGEIRLVSFGRTPAGWQACDGSLLAIAQHSALYQLIGTAFGGDGQTTFAVPDMRGRLPIHDGQGSGLSNYVRGQAGGSETVRLAYAQQPAHSHTVQASTTLATAGVADYSRLPAAVSDETIYATDITGQRAIALAGVTLDPVGKAEAHDNTMPTMPVHFCMALEGVFPSLP